MAKNTHPQEAATGTSDSYTAEEASDPRPPVVIRRAMLGDVDRPAELGEEESPSVSKVEGGTDSLASSESEARSDNDETVSHQEHAQMTASRSSEVKEDSSTVHSTDGAGQEAEQNQSASKRVTKKAPAKKASSRSVGSDPDFSEFE